MKKMCWLLAVFSACFTACTSVSAGVGYLDPMVKPARFDENPFGGLGFGVSLDTKYARYTMDIYPWTAEEYPDAYSPVNSSHTFFAKYPIELGRITAYPLVGYGLPFGLTAGAGVDVLLAGKLALRGEAVYGFGGYADEIGKTGALSLRAGIVWTFSAGGVGVSQQFRNRTIAIEDHAKLMVGVNVRIMKIDGVNTTIQSSAFVPAWAVLPPGVHTLAGFRMSSVSEGLYPESPRQDETGGEDYVYYFQSTDADNNGLQDSWFGTVLLQEGHYYWIVFEDDGLAPKLFNITYVPNFSKERGNVNKTLGIK
jgi:hypothetical protein